MTSVKTQILFSPKIFMVFPQVFMKYIYIVWGKISDLGRDHMFCPMVIKIYIIKPLGENKIRPSLYLPWVHNVAEEVPDLQNQKLPETRLR